MATSDGNFKNVDLATLCTYKDKVSNLIDQTFVVQECFKKVLIQNKPLLQAELGALTQKLNCVQKELADAISSKMEENKYK